jgi:Uma2 family endonuclease
VRAVLVEPDPEWLEARRRLGIDRFDEVWDGVLHVAPMAGTRHMRFESELEAVLRPIAAELGLEVFHQSNLFDPTKGEQNFRVPDLLVVKPEYIKERGVEGRCELVIEILSPHDESRDTLPFYAKQQVQEIWLVEPKTRALEVYVLRGGTYFAVTPTRAGAIEAPALAITLEIVAGPKLRLTWATGSSEI